MNILPQPKGVKMLFGFEMTFSNVLYSLGSLCFLLGTLKNMRGR